MDRVTRKGPVKKDVRGPVRSAGSESRAMSDHLPESSKTREGADRSVAKIGVGHGANEVNDQPSVPGRSPTSG